MENYPYSPKFDSSDAGYYQITTGFGAMLLDTLDNTNGSNLSCVVEPPDPANKQIWHVVSTNVDEIAIIKANTGFYLGVAESNLFADAYVHDFGNHPTRRWRLKYVNSDKDYVLIESVRYPGYVLGIPNTQTYNKINLQPVSWPGKWNQCWKFTPVNIMINTSTLEGNKDAKDQIKQLTSNLETEQNKVTELGRNLQDAYAKATDLEGKLTAAEIKLNSTNEALAASNVATTATTTANDAEIESLKKELVAAKAEGESFKNTIKDLTKVVEAATATPNKEASIIEEELEEEEEEEFKGKLAIIDGAGTVFGRAVALKLQQRGAILALNDQEDSIGLEETTKSLSPQAVIWKSSYKTTIASEAITFIKSLIDKKYPDGISYIFNCASLQSSSQELELLPCYRSRYLCALIYLTRAAIPYLAINASFINTSCMSGRWLQDYTPPDPDTQKQAINYAVEHGIIGFSRSIVQELQERRPGVRMNIIATEYIDKVEDKQREGKRDKVAETIADAVVYLFSQKSKAINGSILDLDEEDENREQKGLYW